MFMKNVIFFVFFMLITANTVFSQSISTEGQADYRNDGLNLYGADEYEDDYTTTERLLMGTLNVFFGLGSSLNGRSGEGMIIATMEIAGIVIILAKGRYIAGGHDSYNWNTGRTERSGGTEGHIDVAIGYLLVGGGIILGYILPFTYHKYGSKKVSQGDFPFSIEPAFTNNGEIGGLRVSYSFKY
jgi:hypothetical protein